MILQFVKTNILSKKLKNFLTIFAIMISVMLIICIQNISAQLGTNVIDNISEYDLIVGKSGSSTTLVMTSVFYYGTPEGNIDISYLEQLQNNKFVEKAVPLGMGDSYKGYKIIGTSPLFFDNESFSLKEGNYIENELDVVLGSTVARKTGLKIGDTFKSQHGLGDASTEAGHHDENMEYKVVGILNPTNTPNDTVLFTTIETLWHAHGLGHDEDMEMNSGDMISGDSMAEMNNNENESSTEKVVSHGTSSSENAGDSTLLLTAVLVRSKGLSEQNQLYQSLSRDGGIQAIIPTETLRSLLNTLNIGEVVITFIAAVSVGLSIIMLFITMLTSSIERRKDISILRALGAKRKTVFVIIITEILIIAVIGILLGFIAAHIFIAVLGNYIVTYYGLNISGWIIQADEIKVMLITVVLSLLAGIIPAMMVYKTDATRYLK